IGRRGAENIKMMLNQELVYTVTTNINVVNTRLNNLTVTVDGNFHDFTSGLSSAFDFTLLPVFAAKRITVNAVPAMPNDVNVAISGAVTVLETEVDLAKGRNVITITSAQNGGGGQSIYRININNYPVSTPTTVTLTPKSGQLEVKWDEIIGASGYWVYYNTIPDLVSAQRFPNVITETEAVITGAPGSTLFVWVQAVSGIDAQRLDSPTFSVPVSATILSNNSTLRLLSFSPYSFFPSFFFNTEDYELIQEIANDQDELTVRFARVQDDQRVVWRMNNGATSQNITGDEFTATGFSNIGINKNTLYITVTSVDGTATTTYKIDIYKKPAPPAWAATPFTSHSPDGDKGGKVTVNWDADSVSGHTGFQVYCGPYSNSQVGGTTATVNSPTQGYTDVGNLEPNILYYFWVRSFSGDIGPGSRTVYSDWSPVSQSQSTVNRLNSLTLTNTDNDDLSFSRLRLNYTVNTQYDTTNTTTVGFQKVNPAIQQVTIGLNENAPVALDPLAQTLTLTSLRTGRNIIEVTSTSVFGDVLTYTIIVNRRPGIPVLTDSYTSGNGFLSSVNMGAIDGADFYDVYHNTTGANPTETPASYTFNSITNNGSIASGTIGTTGSLPEGRVYVWVRAKAGNVVGAWSERKEYYVGVAFNHDMLRSENGNPRTRYIAPGTYNISSAHNPQVTGNLTLIPIGNVTLLRLGEYTSEILNVPSGATLNLGHSASPPAYVGTLTIDGAGISAQRAAIIVSGTCNIFSRVTIQNNHNSQTTMDSGLGSGGGLNIIAGSATLNGGSIRNNHSSFQGGGVVVRGSGNIRAIFYLESGYITQNTTSGEGSGLFATGLQNAFAEIYWNGGEIINNTGGTNNKNNGIHFANEFVEQNW
ncbi:MAG: fibronectin type III domain-containing protein, partial [Treponema sp.]|nr:fibronectin type III domain-containing protein [Treponema sp.]